MVTRLRGWSASRLALVLGGAALLLGSAAIGVVDLHAHQTAPAAGHSIPAKNTASVPHVVPAPPQYNPSPARVVAPAPHRLQIPAIGVDASVESVGVTPELQLKTPQDTE